MTRTRYALALLLQSFGLHRRTKRLTDAAFELQLMQDGEEILGLSCWKHIEKIEELSMEYWNLRKMEREEKELMAKLEEAENTLNGAQNKRAEVMDRSKDIGEELLQKRDDYFTKIDELEELRENILDTATQTKRKHAALKMKHKVLQEEDSDHDDLEKCKEELKALKAEFTEARSKISATESQIKEQETELAELQEEIDSKQKGSKGEATESFSLISKANRDITTYRAELGLLNENQAKAFREVGRFLNVNATREDCRKATKEQRGILEQTRLLYRSINLNRRLVERSTG